jgi:integrase
LKLKNGDVDMNSGVLRLLETKGNRERLVPMSATLTQVCMDYRNNPEVRDYKGEYFFPAPDQLHYAVCTIYERFRQCLFAAGIPHGGRGKGPRLHDIRHTFAVHTLNAWAKQGRDLYVALPILKTYLGHTCLKSTAQYLRLVPEAYEQITSTFEAHFGDVFPEVPYED